MGLDIRIEAKMSQSLVMNPRMQQAIKMLQYNHLDMVAHMQDALLENPTLEVVPDSQDSFSDAEQGLRDGAKRAEDAEQHNGTESTIDWEKFLNAMQDGPRMPSVGGGSAYDELPPIETNLTYGESLADHLLFQMRMLRCAQGEARIAELVIQNLDHRGYLQVPVEELAEEAGVDLSLALDGLEIVQNLDPLGCGARDLSECLSVQAHALFPEDEVFPRLLVPEHLHNLEKRAYPAIAKALGIEVEDVIEYHKMMQENFDPLPGRGFTTDDPRYITPDIAVDKHGEDWVVVLNEEGMPDLRISRYYQKILKGASKKDREYLLDKLRGAEFLIKSVQRRRKTIRRVMESILKFQREFFDHGVDRLRPLVLQDVADDIGVHMSTVSRATANKYVQTPHGIFELKYFFSAGVRQDSGDDLAAEAIKKKIKAIVAAEDPRKPVSDQAIADHLKKDGVAVARRTVAKYREAMGIMPSSQRKAVF